MIFVAHISGSTRAYSNNMFDLGKVGHWLGPQSGIVIYSGIPQMGPIRAPFWLPSAPLASWTHRNWRKTDHASGIGPIPRSKNVDLSVIWTHVPREFVPNP